MNKPTRLPIALLFIAVLIYSNALAQQRQGQAARVSKPLHEVNQVARPDANHVVAIVGATLIDGRGGPPVADTAVVVRGERIIAVGKGAGVRIPSGA